MKSTSIPPLHPDRVRKQGMREVLRGAARFLQAHGFWPQNDELARYLRAPKHAVVWYVDELVSFGVLERHKPKASYSQIRVTARGWQALGVKPLAPYAPRPGRARRATIAQQVVRSLGKQIHAVARMEHVSP